MRDPPQRLFNFYTWGGYLMLHAPDVRVFIDGRATTLYSKELAADYFTIIDTHRGWRKKLEEHAVDAVLAPIGSGVAVLLQQQRPPWRVAYRDPRSVLLFPPADPMRPELAKPSELLPDGADLRLSRGYQWMRNGNLDRASTALLAAQRMDPMQLLVYEQLIAIAARRGDADEVRRWIDEALRIYPRRSDPIWAFAAQAWELMGQCEAKLDALHQLQLGSPGVPDAIHNEVRDEIAKLESPIPRIARAGCKDR
jgi:tetratricopeptide (TPR) repeat protein